MATRKEVYNAISGEREYQNEKWGGLNDAVNSISAYTLWMEHQLDELRQLASTQDELPGTPTAEQMLHVVRKATALGVACMETHGAPLREGF